jgi:membrane protease subunit HflC
VFRGQGDAESAEIFAKAYSEDTDFYAFYRSMIAYKQSLGKSGNIMVLEPDSDFFKFFKQQK